MALEKLRSSTNPRSYITATLKADCAEPDWAARISQPAPALGSLGMPMPCTSRRASSSMAAMLPASARSLSSTTGMPAQSSGRLGIAGAAGGGEGTENGAEPAGTRRSSARAGAGAPSPPATTPAAGAKTIANEATIAGRFSRKEVAAGLPVIPGE
jgi:hypothetical protein